MAKIQKVKGIYGKPWSKLANIKITKAVLHKIGEVLVEEIVKAARDEASRAVGLGFQTLPKSEKFYQSFGYRVVGASTVEVTTTWPWIQPLLEGSEPFKMDWLTQARGVKVVPLEDEFGRVVFRTAPLNLSDAWIHPGIAKHKFLSKGIENGRKRSIEVVKKFVVEQIKK